MSKRPQLMIVGGERDGERFDVPETGLRLGRSSSNDIHLSDGGLSRNHCLFEPVGEEGLRVTDLASANGTYVNGTSIEGEAKDLRPGDTIEVGDSVLRVVSVGEPAAPAIPAQPVSAQPVPAPSISVPPVPAAPAPAPSTEVDLGFGGSAEAPEGAEAKAAGTRRSPLANILWAALALIVIGAIALVMLMPGGAKEAQPQAIVERKPAAIDRLLYEKVEADSERIFRYNMTLEGDLLRVVFDDIPAEDRHVDKKARISAQAKERILEIFATKGFDELDNSYSGSSAMDENELKSWRIRVVRGGEVRDILVENTIEPDAFRNVREALEAFSRNELGIWAVQYTREKLIELSEASAAVGDAKWDEREVEYGNLAAAIKAYREAVFYLDTVNPKPEGYSSIKQRLSRTEEELALRYKDQRFIADKAINLADWETAKRELTILCEMVPDKDDDRHAEANAKLVDVENRMKKAKGGR